MSVYLKDTRLKFVQDPIEFKSFSGASSAIAGAERMELDISLVISGSTIVLSMWEALSARDVTKFALALYQAAMADEIKRGAVSQDSLSSINSVNRPLPYTDGEGKSVQSQSLEAQVFFKDSILSAFNIGRGKMTVSGTARLDSSKPLKTDCQRKIKLRKKRNEINDLRGG